MTYKMKLIRGFWQYVIDEHPSLMQHLDRKAASDSRPPVFKKLYERMNILFDPAISSRMQGKLTAMIPESGRHRWFRSMSSSQALTRSIFGNVVMLGEVDVLKSITDEEGSPLLGSWNGRSGDVELEYSVNWLGEPRSTSIDAFFSGKYGVAVECKLTESEFGSCSRPGLDPSIEEYCDGSYTFQNERKNRCSLSEIGVKYWEYIPRLFKWQDEDHSICPVRSPYQLVRNILAAVVSANGKLEPEKGHALVLYDARNPAFHESGDAFKAFMNTKKGLIDARLLRKCSWQHLLSQLSSNCKLRWLLSEINSKYRIQRL